MAIKKAKPVNGYIETTPEQEIQARYEKLMTGSHELLNQTLRDRKVRTVLDPKALKVELILRHEYGNELVDDWLAPIATNGTTVQAAGAAHPFPHGARCPDCLAAKRCNQCSMPAPKAERCANGRCPACCRAHCNHTEA